MNLQSQFPTKSTTDFSQRFCQRVIKGTKVIAVVSNNDTKNYLSCKYGVQNKSNFGEKLCRFLPSGETEARGLLFSCLCPLVGRLGDLLLGESDLRPGGCPLGDVDLRPGGRPLGEEDLLTGGRPLGEGVLLFRGLPLGDGDLLLYF